MIMASISTRFSSLLLLLAVALAWNQSGVWNKLTPSDQLKTIGLLLFFFVMTATGWLYSKTKRRSVGCMHTALLFAVAIYGLKTGFSVFQDRSIMGGRGPDANPMAGVVYGFGLFMAAIGLIGFVLGVGILLHIIKVKPPKT